MRASPMPALQALCACARSHGSLCLCAYKSVNVKPILVSHLHFFYDILLMSGIRMTNVIKIRDAVHLDLSSFFLII
jgi:hypothetical protein